MPNCITDCQIRSLIYIVHKPKLAATFGGSPRQRVVQHLLRQIVCPLVITVEADVIQGIAYKRSKRACAQRPRAQALYGKQAADVRTCQLN